ncbi:proline-rich receptor-like protein kinase PERK10 [Grus japonensis]|uniref:Proline-rich receptor-like protein kinase PERK10 n=1 Tax=Grus japonensis TaxID=30415 RepID=A0ABC9Y956_GRUJA
MLVDSENILVDGPDSLASAASFNDVPDFLQDGEDGDCTVDHLAVPMLGDADPFWGVAASPLQDPKGKESGLTADLPTWLPLSPLETSEEGSPESSEETSEDSPLQSPRKDSLKDPQESPPLSPLRIALLSPLPSPLAPPPAHGPSGGGGSAEAAPGPFDLLAAAARRRLGPCGAQIGRGRWQEGQAPRTSRHPHDAGDLPAGQHATQEEQEDGGTPGGQTSVNPVRGVAGHRRMEADSTQEAASREHPTAAMGLPST